MKSFWKIHMKGQSNQYRALYRTMGKVEAYKLAEITQTRHGEFRLWNCMKSETIDIFPTVKEAKDYAKEIF